ncbi:VOC family protein [Parafilimonas sp.]|uniref:VOC family protein n=1 Tax=Parafilimonas sp. TaxID=1969739 RepID=UPI003F81DE64
MKTIYSYLSFNGNCREAMVFYKKCLGGELSLQTIGESPLSETMPAKMKKCILHAVLSNKEFVLMGTDMVSESGLLKGNAVSLVLTCSSEKEIRECYKKLSQGGEQTHPLENTFWNALFGGLTDKYGNTWILNYNRGEIKQP